jgi:hypothetical protein
MTSRDSAKLSESGTAKFCVVVSVVNDEDGEIMSWIGGRGLKVAGRGRLLRGRPRFPAGAVVCSGLRGKVFSNEEELLLSRTDTGLEVWNWLLDKESLSMVTVESSVFTVRLLPKKESSVFTVRPPPEKESSQNVESHSK